MIDYAINIPRINIILAALNESSNLQKLIVEINNIMTDAKLNYQIICCIDGSSDNSIAVINNLQKQYPIILLPVINQRGLGCAFKRLFYQISQYDEKEIIISLDADNTHLPSQIPKIIDDFIAKNLDLIVVSRFYNGSIVSNFPTYRLLISRMVAFILNLLFPIRKFDNYYLKDYTSGYRLYKNAIIQDLIAKYGDEFITEPQFTYTCEILIKLSRQKISIAEFPIIYDYKNKLGASNLDIKSNLWRLLIMIYNLLRR
jgi:dolichol-phosphate mannosyltransferase